MRNERDIRFDAASGAWFGQSRPVSPGEMAGRVWRFGELIPSPRAFLDCTLPGHVRTLYSALGGGSDDEQLEGTAVEAAAGGGDDDEAAEAGERVMVKVRFVNVFFNGEAWPISASVVEILPGPGGGAAAGGVARTNLGRVLAGGRQGAVTGAAAGAVRGSAILLAADEAEPALPVGTILRLRLDEPLVFGLPNI